jgi:hypothetical protein
MLMKSLLFSAAFSVIFCSAVFAQHLNNTSMLMYDAASTKTLTLVPASPLTANRVFTFPDYSGNILATTLPLTDGQIAIGSTGIAPVAAKLTAGTGINILSAAGSITISSSVGIGTGGFAYTANPNPVGVGPGPAPPAVAIGVAANMGFGTVAGGNTNIIIANAARMLITICGDVQNTTNNDGATMQIYYADAAVTPAPANQTNPAVGNAIGSVVTFQQTNNGVIIPFNLNAIATGLTPGHTYWIDVGLARIGGGTATIKDITVSAIEF